MPRSARIVIPGVAHHVTQRGNSQQSVFLDDADFLQYRDFLHLYCGRYHLRIIAYCLMTNHLHLVAVPGFESSLANALGRTHQLYSNYFHDRHKGSGHLWQSRFYSCPMDREHTMNALAYVELNPVRAGMVEEPWDYPWSSAAAHVGRCGDSLLKLSRWFNEFTVEGWVEALGGMRTNSPMAKTIRRHTNRGVPLGRDAGFLKQVATWRSTH